MAEAKVFVVVSSVTSPGRSAAVYYIGPFSDESAANDHAAEHNTQPNTSAVVEPLVDPATC